jgi:hypothetical protein
MQAPSGSRKVVALPQAKNPWWVRLGRLSLYILMALVLALSVVAILAFLARYNLWSMGFTFFLLAVWFWFIVVDLGVRYVQHTYGLSTYRSAANWLIASLGSPGASRLKVWDTNLAPAALEEPNLIKTVGGPGIVTVMSGLAVLVEGLDGAVRVLEKGSHTLGRLERVKEVIKLDAVSGQIDSKAVTTRDGIQINVTGIRFRYRQLQPEGGLEDAIKLRVYNLPMDAKGEADWARAVSGVVGGGIGRVISEKYVDYITAPVYRNEGERNGAPAQQPRQLIQQYFQKQGADSLRGIGAELLWYDIGHFEMPRDVIARRTETWQKSWEGNLEILQAQSAEERSQQYWAAVNEGRSEAQADLLAKIVKGLDEIIAESSEPNRNSNVNVFIAGMTQLLSTLGKSAGAE